MFEIRTCLDFYDMLVEDFDDFVSDPTSSRKALHCAIIAFHMHEWVWGDWLSKDYKIWNELSVRDLESFRSWMFSACVWMNNVRDLVNGTKHFARYPEMQTGLMRGYGEGPFGVGPFGAGYLLIDYGPDAAEFQYQPALNLLEVAVRFWRDFLRKYRPNDEIRSSCHHLSLNNAVT